MDICKAIHAFYAAVFLHRKTSDLKGDFTFDTNGIEYIEGPPTPKLHKTHIYPPKLQKFEN